MLEKGRGLIADGFFFIAHSLPRNAGVGKRWEWGICVVIRQPFGLVLPTGMMLHKGVS
jgi:hypothetical protein